MAAIGAMSVSPGGPGGVRGAMVGRVAGAVGLVTRGEVAARASERIGAEQVPKLGRTDWRGTAR